MVIENKKWDLADFGEGKDREKESESKWME